ncbi:putative ADP-ribosylation factor GTPase-activating protein AGD14 isoform X3 [Cinnamomum micranthum f. kanehirae]|uniref:Putative ADP-ribosylation factor GTPase-activating protein AGD14 isoform X3 n=1 Tax=Cinnamomum micranthum f. kanehirae TaxID=337451 RepID=A0A443N5Q9_9MAGN|nr:putative ADP-ribosylation factor GTPase-activating protein AGD14 isoform X3 [Cinnamomum micranthum f. kanehirae]
MASRKKEDEKLEKIIRGLLKLPGNKRCINCNSLGPQYVCTNFWTFVCTTCSGIHREFTHRVKSVSMAKFTPEEVSSLQRGGNERAREVYFKEWNPQRQLAPDSSNVKRLRTFIKHIYVDKRYTGENTINKNQMVKGDKEGTTEFRRAETFHSVSRSLSLDAQSSPGGKNDERNLRYNYSCRSSGHDQGSQRFSSFMRSPRNFEVVDDRFRDDDKVRNGSKNRTPENRRFTDGKSKTEGMSWAYGKDMAMSTPPTVRPVNDSLGKNTPSLQVSETPQADGDRSHDGALDTQNAASSNDLRSTDANVVEPKMVDTGSLIDFDADPEPPPATAPNDPSTGQSVQQPTMSSSIDSMWASFGFGTQEKAAHSPPKAKTLESSLSELLAPTTAPVGNMPLSPNSGVNSAVKAGDGGQHLTTQKNQPASFTAYETTQSGVPQSIPQHGGAPSSQSFSSSLVPNAQGSFIAQPKLPSQDTPNPSQEATATSPSKAPPTEAKPVGRKELPADLFTFTYSPAPIPVRGWQSSPSHGMAFGMQYSAAMAMPSFHPPSRSTNPFDLTSGSTQVESPRFPSMSALQGSLQNMEVHSPLARTTSLGTPSPTLLHNSSFGTPSQRMVPPQLPTYHPSAGFPSVYMMQQAHGNISPLRHQGVDGFGSQGNPFGIKGVDQQQMPTNNTNPGTSNSVSSLGGNPFG